MDCSSLTVTDTVLNYCGACDLQYGIAFSESQVKDIVDDTLWSRHLPKQSPSLYSLYVRIGSLIKTFTVLPLLELLSESKKDGTKLVISHLDTWVLHGTRRNFVFLLIEADKFYINNPTKSAAFHVPSFYKIWSTVDERAVSHL